MHLLQLHHAFAAESAGFVIIMVIPRNVKRESGRSSHKNNGGNILLISTRKT